MNLKKYIVLPVIALTGWGMSGCSSDFLDKYPLDEQTEATAFKTRLRQPHTSGQKRRHPCPACKNTLTAS